MAHGLVLTSLMSKPDDYPNSVRHFLLIGFLGMFIGAIVFFYMGISRKVNTITHVLTFFIAAVAACSSALAMPCGPENVDPSFSVYDKVFFGTTRNA